jgi:hypothetical protein
LNRSAIRRNLEQLASQFCEIRDRIAADPALTDKMKAVAAAQAEVLADLYQDLRKQPRYRPAVEFFLSDLYGPQDLTERDAQMLRAMDMLKRVLPTGALRVLAQAFELQVLSVDLDVHVAARLPGPGKQDRASFEKAFRDAGLREQRERQIQLTEDIGRLLDSLTRRPEVGVMLRLAHQPARLAGFGQLQDFIERGYEAFRHLGGATEFLQVIGSRQRALMNRLLAPADGGSPQAGGR